MGLYQNRGNAFLSRLSLDFALNQPFKLLPCYPQPPPLNPWRSLGPGLLQEGVGAPEGLVRLIRVQHLDGLKKPNPTRRGRGGVVPDDGFYREGNNGKELSMVCVLEPSKE